MKQVQIQRTKQRSGDDKSPLPDLPANAKIFRTPSHAEIQARRQAEQNGHRGNK